VQRWAKIEPTGWVGQSTWNFLRSVTIQDWKPHAGEHAMDNYSCDLIRGASEQAAPEPEKVSPRDKAVQILKSHFDRREGYTEQPAGSNSDSRTDGIRTAQDHTAGSGTWLRGQPWCGCWCFYALEAAGIQGLGSWMASVALIEDRARRKLSPFTGWTADRTKVRPGDLVVIGGRGVHVATVRGFDGPNTLTCLESSSPPTDMRERRHLRGDGSHIAPHGKKLTGRSQPGSRSITFAGTGRVLTSTISRC
jgi:hypothetical protein